MTSALLLRRVPKDAKWTDRTTLAIMIEMGVLSLFVPGFFIIGGANDVLLLTPLVVLSAFAMGLQYATIVRLNVHGVSTTFVTSTLVNLVWRLTISQKEEDIAISSVCNEETREPCLSERTNPFLGSIGVAYFAGAVASAALISLSRAAAALLPFLLIVSIVIMAVLSRPRP